MIHQCEFPNYVKPIALKFKINPEIPILHVVNTMPTNFQSILSPGILAPFETLAKNYKNTAPVCMDFKYSRCVLGIKKLILKTSFLMPIKHAKEFFKSVPTGVVFLQFLARASNGRQ